MKIIAEPVPPVTQYRKSVPPNVAAAIARALEKLAADRFESAKTFSDALGNPAFTAAIVPRVTPPVAPRRLAGRLAVAGTAVALLAAGALAGAAIARRERVPGGIVRFPVRPPQGTELYLAVRADVPFVLSPDGSRIAFVARKREETITRLYARRIDQLDAAAIAGTEGALSPFFSPDGRSIGFVSPAGAIRRVGVDGGPVQTITAGAAVTMSAPTWGDDGFVAYLGTDNHLHRVNSAGGQSQAVGERSPGESSTPSGLDSASAFPFALPGGRSILATVCAAGILRGGGTCGTGAARRSRPDNR